MWLMLQQDEPEDFVIATGEQHSVREFAEVAFAHLGLDYQDHVVVDPQFLRPADVETLLGDASKARKKLGWTYRSTFKDLVREMVDADLARLKSGASA
jgi:GDPmannose 4,6-dehydratase